MSLLTVITRGVSPSISKCELTCIDRAAIDVNRVVAQHQNYLTLFHRAGAAGEEGTGANNNASILRLVELPPLDDFPDAMFVEDVALMYNECAVITNPGAESRRGEVPHIREAVAKTMGTRPVYEIQSPGTVDGGDVLSIGKFVFIGRSTRSNDEGFAQLKAALAPHGYTVIQSTVHGCLHLKSAASMVTPSTVLINPKWIERTLFTALGLGVLEVPEDEPHAANVLSFVLQLSAEKKVRTIVVAAAYPKLVEKMTRYVSAAEVPGESLRLEVIEADEIAKAEGALTCCSLLSYGAAS